MPVFTYLSVESSSSLSNCTNGYQWIYKVLGDCVTDGKGLASNIFGIISLLIWITVTSPQMVKNCKNIEGVGGISAFLIVQWMLGDTTNLIGCVLTDQLPLQTYLGVFFVFADVILLAQYMYYHFFTWKKKKRLSRSFSNGSKMVLCLAGIFIFMQSFLFKLSPIVSQHPSYSARVPSRHLMSYVFFTGIKDETGYAIGIVSSLFYIGSRLSQIYKNYKRKSTEGLAVLMFWMAVFGNVTYGLSILIRSTEPVFLVQHLPWLVGSLGVVFLDICILIQFKMYGAVNFDTLVNKPLTNHDQLDEEYRHIVDGDIVVSIN